MCELWGDVDAIMEARRYWSLPLQRLRPVLQDERTKQAFNQTKKKTGKCMYSIFAFFLILSNLVLTGFLLFFFDEQSSSCRSYAFSIGMAYSPSLRNMYALTSKSHPSRRCILDKYSRLLEMNFKYLAYYNRARIVTESEATKFVIYSAEQQLRVELNVRVAKRNSKKLPARPYSDIESV